MRPYQRWDVPILLNCSLIRSVLFTLLVAILPLAGRAIPIEEAFQQLKTYDTGQNNAALLSLERDLGRISGDPAQRAAWAERLAGLLPDEQVSEASRLFACQQLRLLAGDAQVPSLAKLLDNPKTADMARLVLQALPGDPATQALLKAVDSLAGNSLIGVLDSLGERRASEAIPALGQRLADPDPKVAEHAARALGKIGAVQAAQCLAEAKSTGDLAAVIRDARLTCAQRLSQAGPAGTAAAIYREYIAVEQPLKIRIAALGGLIKAVGNEALPEITASLDAPEMPLALTALERARQLGGAPVWAVLKDALTKMGSSQRMLCLGVLAGGGDLAALNQLSKLSSSQLATERVEATRELRRLRYSTKDSSVLTKLETITTDAETSGEALSPAPYSPQVSEQRRAQVAASLGEGEKLLAYLDCGVATSAEGVGRTAIRQINGQGWFYGDAIQLAPPPFATVAFAGPTLNFEITGLDSQKYYALGLSWWDYDANGRIQSVQFTGGKPAQSESVLKDIKLPDYLKSKQGPAIFRQPINPALQKTGSLRLSIKQNAGPNAVLSEVWLFETRPETQPAATVVALDPPAKRASAKILLVTGIDYPGHHWKETAPVLKAILEKDPRLNVRVVEDPNFLDSTALTNYDAAILHFMDWETPGPGPAARENLRQFVASGKGLMLTHFACGAWDNNEWPEFKALAGRAWDPKLRGHDPYGKFMVEIADPAHPITQGLEAFETEDELYTCLAGEVPIHVVAKSKSKVDGKDYPMAFVLNYGQGRVFHTVLGHDVKAYVSPGVHALMRRGCAWAAGLQP